MFLHHIARCFVLILVLASRRNIWADDLLIDDFESGTYQAWELTGNAFSDEPARGALPNQMGVSGFRGERLVNTFQEGDKSQGTATSRPFTIERSYLAFLIGGGADKQRVGIELLVNGESVRTATGPESEELEWRNWDVRDLLGLQARIRIYDFSSGGWGHINVDQIIQTNSPPDRFDLTASLAEYRNSRDYLNEQWRPQTHFSPEINWMNDPNGLIYYEGEYHLFYQYNPAGNTWGHMSWGHAVSIDLVHWKHLPLAIAEEDGVMAFSGCCVVDHRNTSGFGENNTPPLVAIYTGHKADNQSQWLAYSNDRGRTWTKYAGNPVLDINERDFRDPKVFWHAPTNRWVMVVALAAQQIVVFYASDDLKQWTELSRFGPAGAPSKPNWECPDLFELPVEGEPDTTYWLLEADMGSGAIAGGSGGEYFIGDFDGSSFTSRQDAQWVDFGRDFYAPVSWSDIPEEDGRRIWLGWFNNWETCLLPTSPWRSCMSVPRELSLRRVSTGDGNSKLVLVQRPVKEFWKLQQESPVELKSANATWPPVAITEVGAISEMNFVLRATFSPGKARSCGVRIRTSNDEFTEIGYDREPSVLYADRRNSGEVKFHAAFAGRHEAPCRLIDGGVHVEIIVDRSTIEVFVNDGEAVLSDRIFPIGQAPIIEVFAGDDSAAVEQLTVTELKSIWRR